MNEGILKFICAITGHDEETIKQMFRDWLKSPSTEQARSVVEPEVMPKIAEAIDKIKLYQTGWEGDEDIVCFNDEPIGGTISKRNRLEFDRWLPSFKQKLKELIQKTLDNNFTA